MHKDTMEPGLQKNTWEYLSAILGSYEAVLEVNLKEDLLSVLYIGDSEKIPSVLNVNLGQVKGYVDRYVSLEERQEMHEFLSRDNLEAMIRMQGTGHLEFRFQYQRELPVWMQAELLPMGGKEERRILCLFKKIRITDRRLFQLGIDQMIYMNTSHEFEFSEMEKDALLKRAMEEAKTDALTLLYNQRAMNRLVDNLLSDKHLKSAILFIDLDSFKGINDQFGHLVGDEVLQKVAARLKHCVGNKGIVGRIGGDEFAVFLPVNQNDAAGTVQELCGKLRDSLEDVMPGMCLTCSIGIAMYPEDGEAYSTLVDRADQALYESKKRGRNCYVFYGDNNFEI